MSRAEQVQSQNAVIEQMLVMLSGQAQLAVTQTQVVNHAMPNLALLAKSPYQKPEP